MKPQVYIKNALKKAFQEAGYQTQDERLFGLEKPKQEEYGDIASALAMNYAKIAKEPPRKLAEKIIDKLDVNPFFVDKIEIAGPGFINFYLAKTCLQQAVLEIVADGHEYGRSDWGRNLKVQLEFVSANPTGPLNIVSARAAALGDVIANLFAMVGYDVQREFYVNDAGRQIRLLGASLSARYMAELGREELFPEDGYHGHYLKDLAHDIITQEGSAYAGLDVKERQELFSRLALERMLKKQKASLEQYRVHYDLWFRETAIRENKGHLAVIEKFKSAGHCFEQDGALWFRSSQFGDEKDRVLITSEGEPTYFLIDIAYHENKFTRGFSKVIDFWGPDHHGYINRMRAALLALGHPAEAFDVYIIQQVNLLRGGETVKMSKRAGEIIEMEELIEEVGVDAARYFFVDRRLSQPLDFDIDLAKKRSDENPVYYVQYAHARICSVLRHAGNSGLAIPETAKMEFLQEETELAVIKKLADYPEIISRSAQLLEPHRLTNYLHELATVYHRFYHDHRIVTENPELTAARILLSKAVRQVLAEGLKILGISAPESM
jgi:arginyl-tRNA synthetase